MPSPAEHLIQILHDASVGVKLPGAPVSGGWNLGVGKFPGSPARMIVGVDATGAAPHPSLLLDFPNVQIMVRGSADAYLSTRVQAVKVKDTLLGISSHTRPNGDRLVSVVLLSDVASIGYDENDLPMFSLNFRLIIEPVASAQTLRTPV